MSDVVEVYDVPIGGEAQWITAVEICRLCRLELGAVVEFADLGLVSPRGSAPQDWQLPVAALARLATAARLMHDLGVNVSGAVLAVELLEGQRELQRQIEQLERLTHG